MSWEVVAFNSSNLSRLAAFICNPVSERHRTKKSIARYLVALVKIVPVPGPKSASAAAPPNATPNPASFFGSCIITNRTRMTQTNTKIMVNNPISRLIDLSLLN